jgi:hypothetical protein
MSESEDMTYEEHIEKAKEAEINDCRLICTHATEKLWYVHMPPDSFTLYQDAQYELLTMFCQKILMAAGEVVEINFGEFVKNSYALFSRMFRECGKDLGNVVFNDLFRRFNDSLVMNLYLQFEKGDEYNFRTLVLIVDLLPSMLRSDEKYYSYQVVRASHELKVNSLH